VAQLAVVELCEKSVSQAVRLDVNSTGDEAGELGVIERPIEVGEGAKVSRVPVRCHKDCRSLAVAPQDGERELVVARETVIERDKYWLRGEATEVAAGGH
jgi:hypothetical protein